MTSDERLATVHPELQARVRKVLAAMTALGFPMVVTAGKRSVSEQQKLYMQGRNGNPGPIVTNADGIKKLSNHQSGRAVDCAFLVDGKANWDEHHPWKVYGWAAMAVGLSWGGMWSGPLVDRPHVELPKEIP